jgi:hypothetical protein
VARYCFWVPGKLQSLNEALDAKARGAVVKLPDGRMIRFSKYGRDKKAQEQSVALRALQAGIPRLQSVYVTMWHSRSNRRTDPDNFVAGSRKVVLDALQKARVLENDGWSQIAGFADYWSVEAQLGVFCCLDTEATLTREQARSEFERQVAKWTN